VQYDRIHTLIFKAQSAFDNCDREGKKTRLINTRKMTLTVYEARIDILKCCYCFYQKPPCLKGEHVVYTEDDLHSSESSPSMMV
jgi:hypothetical protein